MIDWAGIEFDPHVLKALITLNRNFGRPAPEQPHAPTDNVSLLQIPE